MAVYVDCRLAHTVDELPAAFGMLTPGHNKVALRTLQPTGQVRHKTSIDTEEYDFFFVLSLTNHLSTCLCQDELTDLKLVIEDTLDNVATLQDCSIQQSESLGTIQLLGKNTGLL